MQALLAVTTPFNPDLPASPVSPVLRRLCLLVRVLIALGALVITLAPLWVWSSAERVQALAAQIPGTSGPITVDARAMLLGPLVTLLPVAVGLFTLWQLWRLFGQYAAGRVFSRPAQQHLRGFALGVLAAALAAPLTRTLLILVLSLGNPPGKRMLVIGFSWDDYMNLLLGAALLAIATVMAEAVRVFEEHAEFV
jgi:hypothetical protein